MSSPCELFDSNNHKNSIQLKIAGQNENMDRDNDSLFMNNQPLIKYLLAKADSLTELMKLEEAKVFFDKVILIQPDSSLVCSIYRKLENNHLQRNDAEGAIQYYLKMMNYGDVKPYYLYTIATIYDYKMNNPAKAEKYYKEYLHRLNYSPDHFIPFEKPATDEESFTNNTFNRLQKIKEEKFFEGN